MKVVFMGTPDFAVPVLKALIENRHEVAYVLTQPDRPRNKGKVTFSPVKEYAVSQGMEVLQPERLSKDEDVKAKLKAYQADIFIVVAYGQILKTDVLDMPKYGCFNVHGSILPLLRGASPIQQSILEGFDETGVTLMKMDEGMDTGDILAIATTEIGEKSLTELSTELSDMGAKLLIQQLPVIVNGKAKYTKQDESKATKCGMIRKNDGMFDFSDDPRVIVRKVKAYDPWPGTFFESGVNKENKVKIWDAKAIDADCDKAPGTIIDVQKKSIDVSCGGKVLRIFEIQIPGKKRMGIDAFMLGHKLSIGENLTEI